MTRGGKSAVQLLSWVSIMRKSKPVSDKSKPVLDKSRKTQKDAGL